MLKTLTNPPVLTNRQDQESPGLEIDMTITDSNKEITNTHLRNKTVVAAKSAASASELCYAVAVSLTASLDQGMIAIQFYCLKIYS